MWSEEGKWMKNEQKGNKKNELTNDKIEMKKRRKINNVKWRRKMNEERTKRKYEKEERNMNENLEKNFEEKFMNKRKKKAF